VGTYAYPTVDRDAIEEHFGVKIAPTVDVMRSLGASNSSMALGLNPYGNQHSVRADLLGISQPREADQLDRGHELEPLVAELALPVLSLRGLTAVASFGDGSIQVEPWIHCTPDRIIVDKNSGVALGILEIKTNMDMFKPYDIERPDHNLQVRQCAWGVSKTWPNADKYMRESMLVCLAAGEDSFTLLRNAIKKDGLQAAVSLAREMIDIDMVRLHVATIDPDIEGFERDIVPKLSDWYKKHIVLDQMPPIDGSNDCRDALMLSFDERHGVAEISDAIVSLVERKLSIREQIKKLKEEDANVSNHLIRALGPHERAFGEGVSVTIGKKNRIYVKRREVRDGSEEK
jgi:hypothetical protein